MYTSRAVNIFSRIRKPFLIVSQIFIEALFPLSETERILAGMTPEEALRSLPKAPPFDDSVAEILNSASIFAYKDERVSRLVWNIKYKKDHHCAEIAAFALYERLNSDGIKKCGGNDQKEYSDEQIILIPMPSSPRRRRERGYNQCEFILEHLAELDKCNKFVIIKNLLNRTVHTSHQKHKGRKERLKSSRGLFDVDLSALKALDSRNGISAVSSKSKEFLSKSKIVIIDDVITTGSTMKEATETLTAAGFTDVSALSLAH